MDSKHFSIYTIFVFVFVFKLLFIFQGVNLSDEGFHLTQQATAFTDKVDYKEVTVTYFLTQYVGGAWLNLVGAPNLLWARLGGVIVYALNATIIFQILSGYFDRKRTFLVVAASALFIMMHEYITIIHYFTFPSLLLNIWLLVLSQLIKSSEGTIKSNAYGFLLGFLVIPIILSRISLILMLLLPGVIAAYYWKTKTENRQLKKTAPYMIYGLLAAAAAFTLFYMQIGILDYYVGNIISTLTAFITGTKDVGDFGETHSIYTLIGIYFYEYISGIILALVVFVIAVMFSEFTALTGKRDMRYFIVFIILIPIGLIANSGRTNPWMNYYFAEFIIITFSLVLLFLSVILLYVDRKKNIDRTLLLSGVFILFITPLGSYSGLGKSAHGMWLVMPLAVLLAYDALEKAKNIRLKSARPMLDVLLCVIVIMSVFFPLITVYGDDANRLNLNTEFAYPPLRGVYSTPERVKVMDEALFKIDEYTEKGDSVLMVTSIPLLYYLTETKPAIGDPWPAFRPLEKIEEDNEEIINAGRYPKLFVYSESETDDPRWPKTDATSTASGNPNYLRYFKEEYINNLNYTLLWENAAMAIYSKDRL